MTDLVENGTTLCILNNVYDLGEIEKTFEWKKSFKPSMKLVFEIQDASKPWKDGGESPVYTKLTTTKYSSEKSTAFKVAKALGFSIDWVPIDKVVWMFIEHIGSHCLIEVENAEYNGTSYVRTLNTFSKPVKWMELKEPRGQSSYFDFTSSTWQEDLAALPTWIQDDIKKGRTYQNLINEWFDNTKEDSYF